MSVSAPQTRRRLSERSTWLEGVSRWPTEAASLLNMSDTFVFSSESECSVSEQQPQTEANVELVGFWRGTSNHKGEEAG